MIIRCYYSVLKKQPDQYEFLDLSDVNDDERTRLSTALQPINAASSVLTNNDVNQIVTAGIQFAPQYEYIQSNLNWPAVPYGKLRFLIFFFFFFVFCLPFFEFCIFYSFIWILSWSRLNTFIVMNLKLWFYRVWLFCFCFVADSPLKKKNNFCIFITNPIFIVFLFFCFYWHNFIVTFEMWFPKKIDE